MPILKRYFMSSRGPPIFWLCLGCLAAAVGGCEERERAIAPVSGTVTLDGKPLADATVRFIPMDQPNRPLGVVSQAETDAQAHFHLTTSDGRPGAVVGQHAVRISTLKGRRIANSESTEITTPEKLPERYNNQTQLEFTVPEQGTDKAEFDLKS